MKTLTETKFDQIVKEVYHQTLKPLGYKKKGNNFYLPGPDIGKIINLQKSTLHSKDHIRFTINAAIFSPHYFDAYYYYPGKQIPEYPTEPQCVLRRRIGKLLNQNDTWYDVYAESSYQALKDTQLYNLNKVILPFLDNLNTIDDLINEFERGPQHEWYLTLYVLGATGRLDEAKEVYKQSIIDTPNNASYTKRCRKIGLIASTES